MSSATGSSRESNPSRRICHLRAVPLGHVANESIDFKKSLVSLALHSQSRLNSFQTVRSLCYVAHYEPLNFISFLGCSLPLAGDQSHKTMPRKTVYCIFENENYIKAYTTGRTRWKKHDQQSTSFIRK